jgi:hypothetical protein
LFINAGFERLQASRTPMSIELFKDEARQLRVLCYGPSTRIAEIEALLSNVPESLLRSYDDLDVFEDVNALFSGSGASAVAELVKRGLGAGAFRRHAIVVHSDLDYGLVRQYMAYRGQEHAVQVFRSLTAALGWLDIEATAHPALCARIEAMRRAVD